MNKSCRMAILLMLHYDSPFLPFWFISIETRIKYATEYGEHKWRSLGQQHEFNNIIWMFLVFLNKCQYLKSSLSISNLLYAVIKRTSTKVAEDFVDFTSGTSPYKMIEFIYSNDEFNKLINLCYNYNIQINKELILQALMAAINKSQSEVSFVKLKMAVFPKVLFYNNNNKNLQIWKSISLRHEKRLRIQIFFLCPICLDSQCY